MELKKSQFGRDLICRETVVSLNIVEILRGHFPKFCVNRKFQDSGFILESCSPMLNVMGVKHI